MSTFQLLDMIAEELGFVVESAQWSQDVYIIRRPSRNPRYKTEYASVTVVGDIITIQSFSETLARPDVFKVIADVLESPNFLSGSLAPMEKPVGNKFLSTGCIDD